MTEAFISYSRKDKEFVKKLYEALKQEKREVWVDWDGIKPTTVWRKEIDEGIEAADNFIFVISPNSVASKYCKEEIAHARKHNKRLVPIVWQDAEGVDPELAEINYIFFRESNDFNTALQSLLQALDTDLAHVKEHTRLLMLALEWERNKRNSSYLLQGSQLEQAEQWFTTGAGKKPLITPLQQEYIGESRKAQRVRHRRRFILITIGLVISTGSAIFAAINWKEADRQKIAAQKSELQALISASDARFTVNRDTIDALIEALKAGKKLKQLERAKGNILNQERAEVMTVLGQAIYWVRERDRLVNSNIIPSVSFSPDGEAIATAENKTVKLWIKHGHFLPPFQGHQRTVMSVSFSPDSQILASASLDGTVKLWNKQGNLLKTFDKLNTRVRTVSFSPDGKTLASGSDDKLVRLWNREGQQLQILKGHTDKINSVIFSPDGQILLSGSKDQKIKLWNKQGKELKTLEGHTDTVTSLSFSPNGRIFASASLDGMVILWNRDGSFIQKFNTQNRQSNSILGVSFSPDGQTLATANYDSTVTLWDIKNPQDPQEINTFRGHSSLVTSVSFSLDDGTLTLASASQDKTVKLWQINSPWLTFVTEHNNLVNHVSFSPDGEAIAIVSNDGMLKLWNRQDKTIKSLQVTNFQTSDVSFSPDNAIFATASYDGKARLWNRQGKILNTLNHFDGNGRVRSVSFSPDSQIIATAGDDKMVKLWNRQGQLWKSLKHNDNDAVFSVSFSPNGKMIATATYSGTVRLWSLEGIELKSWNYGDVVQSVSFSPDSTVIAIAVGNSVKLRQLNGGEISLNGHNATVSQVTFSSDGQMIASGSDDKTVKLWRKDGTLITTLIGHYAEVNSISFSPDNKTLVSGSKDGTTILWNVENLTLDELMGRGCDWLHDYLTNNSNDESDADNKHLCDGVKTSTSRVR